MWHLHTRGRQKGRKGGERTNLHEAENRRYQKDKDEALEADHMGTLRIDPMHTQRYLKWGRKNEGGRTHT